MFSPKYNPILVTGPTIIIISLFSSPCGFLFQNYRNVKCPFLWTFVHSGKAVYITTIPMLVPSLQDQVFLWSSVVMESLFPYKATYSILGPY